MEEILFINDIFDETENVLNRPDTVFDRDELISLDLSNLPIRELPAELVENLHSIQQLILNGTEVSYVPGELADIQIEHDQTYSVGQETVAATQVAIRKKTSTSQAETEDRANKDIILNLIDRFHTDIPVQLYRIIELTSYRKSLAEKVLHEIQEEYPEYIKYYSLEQVLIKKQESKSKEKTKMFGKVSGSDALQICDNCENTQSTLVRECSNCGKVLDFCKLCKRGYTPNDQQLTCSHCENSYHKPHLLAYIQSRGQCAVCKEKLTLGQYM